MTISLIEADEVKTRSGGRTKGQKYGKYAKAIEPILEWTKKQISNSKDGYIRIKVKDIAKEMGPEFEKKNPTSILWGLRYVFFNEGIVAESGTHIDDDKIIVMRLANETDRLPASLQKFLEEPEEPDEEPEEPDEEPEEPD